MFLLLSVSIGNIFVAMFFPYPMALASLGLQLLFFLMSFILFLLGLKKRHKIIRSFIVTSLHGLALVFIVYIFFNIAVPNREKGDTDATMSALKFAYKYFTRPQQKPENPVQNKEVEKNNPQYEKNDEKDTETNANKSSAQKPAALVPAVEDPF